MLALRSRFHIPTALAATAALALSAGLAQAAAIERAIPSASRILFEEGRYIEFAVSYADPDQRGRGANPGVLSGVDFPIPGNTGDVFEDHWSFAAAYKADLGDKFSYALFFDQPYGADTSYGEGGFPVAIFSYDGTRADLNTYQVTGVLAYDPTDRVKLYGGLRAQRLDASAAIPFIGPQNGLPGYSVDADDDWGFGYLLGAAYSRPEIALRVSLTYYSKIDHDLTTNEFGGITIPGLQDGTTRTDVSTPQSVALEFQTGVAEGTLVFGSVRWVDWSAFAIAPPTYSSPAVVGRPLVDYEEDWWTYTLGVARQFTPNLAGSFTVSYEPEVDTVLTTLRPYAGRTAATAALSYDYGQFNFTGGVTYGRLGDTTNVLETEFDDGSVWAVGLRIGYTF
jgi:long-subunit fatty acid transport protein